jgi:(2Fe-2S) ferredoxin
VRFRRHLFVCTQRRDGGGKPACAGRGGDAILAAVERELASRGSAAHAVAVTACGCLGPCFDGPNAVVYPDGIWYAELSPEDAPALVDHLIDGHVLVARRHDWSDDAE